MAIQILSDLHLDVPKSYNVFEIEPRAPHLALLGDIGNVVAHQDDFLRFLARQLQRFRTVMFVPGNHEVYHSSWPETLDILHAFEEDTRARQDPSMGEFFVLDRRAVRLADSDTVVLGCSLFSHVPPERRLDVRTGMNDFLLIDGWDVDAHNEAHARDLAWLNARVAELERPGHRRRANIAILSHWSPTVDPRAVDPDGKHAATRISVAFSTDLSGEPCFRSASVKLWAFGHTHYNCDFVVDREDGAGPLRLVTNQRGYYFARSKGFDGGKTVEV
ncbi:hypothetical protein VTH06DRAFT_7350 [Thermothelomyces fergusii]